MKEKIVIFGCSGFGRQFELSLDDRDYEIIAYLDNNIEIQGSQFHQKPVLSPDSISDLNFDKIIISMPDHEMQIRGQLARYDIPDEKIETFSSEIPGMKLQELRYVMLRLCMEQIADRQIKGSLAEVGVYKGAFSSYMNYHMPDRKLYLFDTFAGFSPNDKDDHDRILAGNLTFTDGNIEETMAKMTNPHQIHIRKGWFPETAAGINDTFCLVSLDADLYKPIYAGLEFFYPRLEKGGYIFIHDFGIYQWPGVKKAVYQYCEKHNISFVPIPDRCLSCIITK